MARIRMEGHLSYAERPTAAALASQSSVASRGSVALG